MKPRRWVIVLSAVGAGCVLAGTSGETARDDAPDIREFRPSRNGFAFVNSFSGSPLPVSLGGVEAALGAPDRFGLCGGMSAAAADLFLAGRTPPAAVEPPARGTATYTYLYRRQTDSLGASLEMAGKFAAWMGTPREGVRGTRARSAAELTAAMEELDAGRPVALGLVLRGPERPGALWENHQVLAYAVEGAGDADCDVRIYDPNYPKNDAVVIRARAGVAGSAAVLGLPGVSVPVLGAVMERRTGDGRRPTPVRGVFLMPYSAAEVPADIR